MRFISLQAEAAGFAFMKQNVMATIAVLLSTIVSLFIAEFFFRVALPPIPGDEGSVAFYIATAQRQPGAPRLFHAGYHAIFDIKGLYDGADKVDFSIAEDRFIPPSPHEARYKVLFLGGSVAEGIFLNAWERWPARLNVPGEVATSNASMSEAGMLAQYLTAKYLSDRGDRFDLVVLATNHNDTGWSRRFKELGSVYDFSHFDDGLREVYKKDYELLKKKDDPSWFSLRTVAWARHFLRVVRLKSSPDPQKSGGSEDKGDHHSIVVDGLLLLQNGTNLLARVPMAECSEESSPKTLTRLAYEDWQKNLPKFREDIKALLGADLLVVSEPAAFGAPNESFYQRDLRVFPTCDTSAGRRAIDVPDIVAFERERASLYLKAAKDAGAYTFDLAGAMEPFSNGPQGGSLFFDSIHPTPKGAEKFAELLKPVILQTLQQH